MGAIVGVYRPGELILDELAARKWSIPYLTELLDVEPFVVFRLLWGWGRVDEDMAARLAEALGTDAQTWLDLQHAWDEYQR